MATPVETVLRYRILQTLLDKIRDLTSGTPESAYTAELTENQAEYLRESVDYILGEIHQELQIPGNAFGQLNKGLKMRTWYVAELTVNAVPVGPQSCEAVVDKLRLGAVEAPNRAEATRLARERWPDKMIEITRGSQG